MSLDISQTLGAMLYQVANSLLFGVLVLCIKGFLRAPEA